MRPSLTFVGTATTIIRLGGFTLLTDPNFLHKGQFAWLGKGLVSRRLTEPAMAPVDLPALDAIVLSHLHGDHFDRVARRELDHSVPVVTTPHAARRLSPRGFAPVALRNWEVHELQGQGETLAIESVPAVHARGVLGQLLPAVMGSVLRWRVAGELRHTMYVTGDTLLGPHLGEIAARHPDIDTAVVHLGGTKVLGAVVTLDGVGGRDLLERIQPRQAVPVHYDDYGVFRSPLEDFRSAVRDTSTADLVSYVARGDTVELVTRS